MIRFLLLSIIVFLLYIGIASISSYDSHLEFAILDYQIDTTLFTAGTLLIVIASVILVAMKFLFLVINLPSIIVDKVKRYKLKKANERTLKAVAELLMNNKSKSLQIINKVIDEIDCQDEDIINIVKAELENSIDKKIHHLRMLINKKNYSVYAAKALAVIFYDMSQYSSSEEFATKAFNEDDTDTETLSLLIKIYAKIGLWKKMVFIVTKLKRADSKLLTAMSKELSEYYYLAAKNTLADGDDRGAIKYLEESLEIRPDYIDALVLFTEIQVNMNNSSEALKLLRAAYSLKPCFTIAELFIKCSRSSADAIYSTLAGIADPKDYNDLYLAVAAYLDLPMRIKELKLAKNVASYDAGY